MSHIICRFSSSFPSLLKKLAPALFYSGCPISATLLWLSLFSCTHDSCDIFSGFHKDDFPRLYASLRFFPGINITTSRISAARPCLACPSHPPSPPCTFGAERPFPVTHNECTLSVPQRGEDTGKRLAGLFPFLGENIPALQEEA